MEQTSRVEHMQAAIRAIDYIYTAKFADRDTYSFAAIANALVVIADCLNGIEQKLDALARVQDI